MQPAGERNWTKKRRKRTKNYAKVILDKVLDVFCENRIENFLYRIENNKESSRNNIVSLSQLLSSASRCQLLISPCTRNAFCARSCLRASTYMQYATKYIIFFPFAKHELYARRSEPSTIKRYLPEYMHHESHGAGATRLIPL